MINRTSFTCGRDDCRGECRVFQKVINGSTATGYSKKADFHYVVNQKHNWALYDINKDSAQRDDLALKFSGIVDKMSEDYEKWWTEVFQYIHRKAQDHRWSQDFKPENKQ
jgi:hypothetical protein